MFQVFSRNVCQHNTVSQTTVECVSVPAMKPAHLTPLQLSAPLTHPHPHHSSRPVAII